MQNELWETGEETPPAAPPEPSKLLRVARLAYACRKAQKAYYDHGERDSEKRRLLIVSKQAEKELDAALLELAQDAERRKREEAECSGLTARWCPRHGACTCSAPMGVEDFDSDDMDDADCPLHGRRSSHAEEERRA